MIQMTDSAREALSSLLAKEGAGRIPRILIDDYS